MTAAERLRGHAPADRDLICAVANGNLQALGELFERYEPTVRRHIARLGVARDEAGDLVQATFLEVIRASRRFDPQYPARSWLIGMATVMVRRHRRSVRRAASLLATLAGFSRSEPTTNATAADLIEGDETVHSLVKAFEGLSHRKREVFVLVTLEGLSGEEAAAALGIPVNTVWTRLHHARLALRAALHEGEA
jgi:RNA polymerase sigma-70 factor (ECF subfamily)